MRLGLRFGCVVASASLVLCAAACGSFGTNDDTAAPGDASHGFDARVEDHASEDVALATDGGSETDAMDDAGDSGSAAPYVGGDFEGTAGANACQRWKGLVSVVAPQWITSPTHGGDGACKLCIAPANKATFSLNVNAAGYGTYSATLYMRGEGGGSVTGAVGFTANGTTTLGVVQSAEDGAWTAVSAIPVSWNGGAPLVLNLEVTPGCVIIDDVVVAGPASP